MVSSIPPNTAMRSIYPSKSPRRKPRRDTYKREVYGKSKRISSIIKPTEFFSVKEVNLDSFDEGKELKVIGDFPGVTEDDLVIQIVDGKLFIITTPMSERKYQASIILPSEFRTTLKEKEIRNGIMSLILEQVKFENIPAKLQQVFDSCLKKFPELKDDNIELRIIKSRRNTNRDSIDGAKGTDGDKNIVIIFIPELLWGKWNLFKPIIFHELSHYINLENPDKIFYERADRKSIQLWDMLKNSGQLNCKVED